MAHTENNFYLLWFLNKRHLQQELPFSSFYAISSRGRKSIREQRQTQIYLRLIKTLFAKEINLVVEYMISGCLGGPTQKLIQPKPEAINNCLLELINNYGYGNHNFQLTTHPII